MPNQQLLDYINFKIKNGTPNEETKKLLLSSGWKEEDIDNAFIYINNKIQSVNTESINNQPLEKPKYNVNNWIALFYFVIIAFTIFDGKFDNNQTLSNILFFVVLIIGGIAGIAFILNLINLSKNQNIFVRIIFFLVGLGGGWIIFVIALLSGLTGMMRNVHGD